MKEYDKVKEVCEVCDEHLKGFMKDGNQLVEVMTVVQVLLAPGSDTAAPEFKTAAEKVLSVTTDLPEAFLNLARASAGLPLRIQAEEIQAVEI